MPRGFGGHGFGGGFGGRGFGMRRIGGPIIMGRGMGMGGFGSPLLTSLMAGGLGYVIGSNAAQQSSAPPQPPVLVPQYPPYPYESPPPPAWPAPPANPDSDRLAKLQLLGELHGSGVLNDEEFEREKQRILRV